MISNPSVAPAPALSSESVVTWLETARAEGAPFIRLYELTFGSSTLRLLGTWDVRDGELRAIAEAIFAMASPFPKDFLRDWRNERWTQAVALTLDTEEVRTCTVVARPRAEDGAVHVRVNAEASSVACICCRSEIEHQRAIIRELDAQLADHRAQLDSLRARQRSDAEYIEQLTMALSERATHASLLARRTKKYGMN